MNFARFFVVIWFLIFSYSIFVYFSPFSTIFRCLILFLLCTVKRYFPQFFCFWISLIHCFFISRSFPVFDIIIWLFLVCSYVIFSFAPYFEVLQFLIQFFYIILKIMLQFGFLIFSYSIFRIFPVFGTYLCNFVSFAQFPALFRFLVLLVYIILRITHHFSQFYGF